MGRGEWHGARVRVADASRAHGHRDCDRMDLAAVTVWAACLKVSTAARLGSLAFPGWSNRGTIATTVFTPL
jgi:hypothetical protein